MNVILVDATAYEKKIDPVLCNLKKKYFKIKNIVRHMRLGEHNQPKHRTYSIGLLRIATILNENGYDVKYVELKNLDALLANTVLYAEEDLKAEVVTKAGTSPQVGAVPPPDIIAFSAVCPTVPLCSEYVERYRNFFPRTKFAIGGAQLNVAPHTTKYLFGNFDIYSVGYDIEAAEQIVGKKLQQISARYVDYSLLPYELSEYSLNTFTTLGCPFLCRYCQDGLMPYNAVNADGDLPYFKRRVPSRSCIHFFDSILGGGDEKRVLKICEDIKKTGHDFLLSCDYRADLINERVIKAMVEAGFSEIRLGAESADDELLALNRRSLKTDRLLRSIQLIREKSDIYITLYSAVGFPGATYENISDTTTLLTELLENRMIDEVKNCVFVPYPYDEPRFSEAEVKIFNRDWKDYDRQSFPVYDLKGLKAADIWKLFLEMTDAVNQSWMKGFSIDNNTVENQSMYGEYIVENYI